MFKRARVVTSTTDSATSLAPVSENEAQQHCLLGLLRKNLPHALDRHKKRLPFPLDIVMCWRGVWSAINHFGMREASLKMKPIHGGGKKSERSRKSTEPLSSSASEAIRPLHFQLQEQMWLGFSVAYSHMHPNGCSSDYTHKTTRDSKRQGDQ